MCCLSIPPTEMPSRSWCSVKITTHVAGHTALFLQKVSPDKGDDKLWTPFLIITFIRSYGSPPFAADNVIGPISYTEYSSSQQNTQTCERNWVINAQVLPGNWQERFYHQKLRNRCFIPPWCCKYSVCAYIALAEASVLAFQHRVAFLVEELYHLFSRMPKTLKFFTPILAACPPLCLQR